MVKEPVISIVMGAIHEVGRANDAPIARDREGSLPGFHLIDDEVTGLDELVRRQVFGCSIEVVVSTVFRDHSVIPVHRKKCFVLEALPGSAREHGPKGHVTPMGRWIRKPAL